MRVGGYFFQFNCQDFFGGVRINTQTQLQGIFIKPRGYSIGFEYKHVIYKIHGIGEIGSAVCPYKNSITFGILKKVANGDITLPTSFTVEFSRNQCPAFPVGQRVGGGVIDYLGNISKQVSSENRGCF